MNTVKYLILSGVMTIAGALFGAQAAGGERSRFWTELPAAKTVEEAQSLLDQKADVRMGPVENMGQDRVYRTLISDVLLNLNKDPELIEFYALRGVPVSWGRKHKNIKANNITFSEPLLCRFLDVFKGICDVRREAKLHLDQIKDRCQRVMRVGALVSTPVEIRGVTTATFAEELVQFGDGVFNRGIANPVEQRYFVALCQTIVDTGRELCLKRRKAEEGRVKAKLLEGLPQSISSDLVGVIVSYHTDPISEKEEPELAKIKALLNTQEVQEFMRQEATASAAQ